MKANSVNEYKDKDNDTIIPSSIEECMKLFNELKMRQSDLELKLKEKDIAINKLFELNKAIVEHVDLIIITTDTKGVITSFNPWAEKKLGYKAEEVVGNNTPLIFYDPDDLKELSGNHPISDATDFSSIFEQIINQNFRIENRNEGVERTFLCKDGSRFKALLSVSKILDGTGQTDGYVKVIIDISRRKLAEEQLLDSENKNKAILKAVPDSLYKIQKDGTYINLKKQVGHSLYDSIQTDKKKNIADVKPIELAHKIEQHFQKALISKEVTKFEYNQFLKGVDSSYESRMIAISEDEVLSIVRDVSERKVNERYSVIIRDLGFDLAGTSSITKAFSLVINAMLQIDGINAVGVYLFSKRNEDFVLVASEGISKKYDSPTKRYKLEKEHKEIIEKGGSVYGVFKKLEKDNWFFFGEDLKHFGIIPIMHEGVVIGTVNIASKMQDKLKHSSSLAIEVLASQIWGTLSRISSENALKQTQLNFRMIFETIDDYVFIFSEKGKIIQTNPIVELNLGYTARELRGMTVFDVHPPERKDEVKSLLNGILKRELSVCSVPLYKKNGENIAVETKVVHGSWNEMKVLYGICRDVTVRQRAEDELKMQSLAFEAFAFSIIITDIHGSIQWANSSFSKMSGYTLPEILGRNPGQFVKSGKQNQAFYKEMWDTILRGEVWRGELINKRKDHSLFPEELTITPVKNRSGEISNFIAIKIDISRRKEMEEELRLSEERWHFALEGSGDGVFDWNLVTDKIFFSDRWKTMLGYEPAEIDNAFEEWERLVHPDDLKTNLDDFDDHISGKTALFENEHRMLCKDGSYKWILARGKVIGRTADGNPLRIIGTHKDISDHKMEQQQMRKNFEMEKELNDLKSRFVAMASHEFRTPLSSILIISDTLIYHHKKMDSNQLNDRLNKIKNHVFYLTNIVNDVLHLSKIQEGKVGFSPIEVDLIAICLSIIDESQTRELLKNVHITFSSPFSRLIAQVDNRLIIHVINNLISNAIKYAPDEPFVNVELKLENGELILSVRDNGIGIPEDDVKHLFTPFFRARNASSIQGNGLGLSITSESVRLHGGKVYYSKNQDKGSTFTVYLPESLVLTSNLKSTN